MGANRYSCGISLGAIRLPLWLKIAIIWPFFLIFFAFFVTVFGLVTTFMNALGTERTQTLVTHVGWWYRVIFGLWRYLSESGVVQKWLFLGSISGPYGGLVPGWGSDLESVL